MAMDDELEHYLERLAGVLGHADRRMGLKDYCRGLMLPLKRKSIEPLAAAMDREAAEPMDLEGVCGYSSNPGLTEQQIRFVRETIGNLPKKLQELIIMKFTTGSPRSKSPGNWASARARSRRSPGPSPGNRR